MKYSVDEENTGHWILLFKFLNLLHGNRNHASYEPGRLSALKAFARALKVKFEISPYNSYFVAKTQHSKKQVEQGNFTIPDPNKSLWENIG